MYCYVAKSSAFQMMPKLFFMLQGSFVLPAQPSTKQAARLSGKRNLWGNSSEDLSLLREFQVSLG